jgi:hypothetical protein
VRALGEEQDRVRCPACGYEILLTDIDEEGKSRKWGRRQNDRASVTSRVYVHEGCGGQTAISGDEFARVTNPFTFVSQTYCASCGGFARLGGFFWADTGESVTHFRRRMHRRAPWSLKLGVWIVGPLLAAALCALIGYFCSPKLPAAGAIAGAVVGAFFFVAFLTPYVSRWLWGIDYRGDK